MEAIQIKLRLISSCQKTKSKSIGWVTFYGEDCSRIDSGAIKTQRTFLLTWSLYSSSKNNEDLNKGPSDDD